MDNHQVTRALAVMIAFPVLLSLTACSSDPTGDSARDVGVDVEDRDIEEEPEEICPSGRYGDEGVCLPKAPEGTPSELCPSGEFRDHPAFSGNGICLPTPPQGTPPEQCPSGQYATDEMFEEAGVCLPLAPELTDWECPQSWQTDSISTGLTEPDGTFQSCRPPDVVSECPSGQWPSPRQGCVDHGMTCPTDAPWATESEIRAVVPGFAGDILYVNQIGDLQEDGSRQAPFSTVEAALSAAGDGDIISLAAGDYEESLVLDREVAVLGACVAETRLLGAGPTTVTVEAPSSVHVGNLTVVGDERSLDITAFDGSQVQMESLAMESAGVRISGPATTGQVHLRDLVVSVAETNQNGALEFAGSQSATLEAVSVHAPNSTALRVKEGFDLNAEDLLIYDSGSANEAAISISLASSVRFHRLAMWDIAGNGLEVTGGETQVELSDFFFGTASQQEGASTAIYVDEGATLEARRLLVDGGQSTALYAGLHIVESQAELEQLAIVGLQRYDEDEDESEEERLYVHGIWAESEADVTLNEAFFRIGARRAVMVDQSSLTARDLVIIEAGIENPLRLWNGLFLTAGELDLERVVVFGAEHTALFAEEESVVHATDLAMRWEIVPGTTSERLQIGLVARPGATGDYKRILIEGAGARGIEHFQAETTLHDLVIRDLQGYTGPDLSAGEGIAMSDGSFDLDRFLIQRITTIGLKYDGGEMHLRNGVIGDLLPFPDLSVDGVGIVATGEYLRMEQLAIRDSNWLGLLGGGLSGTPRIVGEDIRIVRSRAKVPVEEDSPDIASVGVLLSQGSSQLTGARWWISEINGFGIQLANESVAEIEDLVVEDIYGELREPNRGKHGVGAIIMNAAGKFSRALIQETRTLAVRVDGGTLELSDAVVDEIRSEESSNTLGVGLFASDSWVEFDRVVLQRSRLATLWSEGYTAITARDLRISQSLAATGCDIDELFCRGGHGLVIYFGLVDLDRFVIEQSQLAGIYPLRGAAINARRGILMHNKIGLNNQSHRVDLDLDFHQVSLRNNQEDIAAREFPVPSLSNILEDISNQDFEL